MRPPPGPAAESAADLVREMEWENVCVQRGVDRFRKRQERAPGHQSTPGMRLMDSLLPPLVAAFEAELKAAVEAIASGTRSAWPYTLSLVPADITAVCQLQVLLRDAAFTPEASRTLQATLLDMARAFHRQAEFVQMGRRAEDGEDPAAGELRRCLAGLAKSRGRGTSWRWLKKLQRGRVNFVEGHEIVYWTNIEHDTIYSFNS